MLLQIITALFCFVLTNNNNNFVVKNLKLANCYSLFYNWKIVDDFISNISLQGRNLYIDLTGSTLKKTMVSVFVVTINNINY